MIIKISVWNVSQYTKSGKLKKSANSEMSFTFMDVPPHTEGGVDLFLKDVASKLKMDYKGFESPYIFTHLNAVNAKGERVLIFEEVGMKDGYITTSPEKLRALLK